MSKFIQNKSSFHTDVKVDSVKKLYLDGGGDTYIVGEPVIADTMQIVVGGTTMINLQESVANVMNVNNSHLCLDATYKLFFDSSALGHTYITQSSDDILDIYVGGDKMLSLDESVDMGVTSLIGTLKIKEVPGASNDTASYGQLWIKDEGPNELYFTNDDGDDIQITSGDSLAGGGGTQYWNQMVPGYTTNKTSTTLYYTFYRGWYENWSNSDSNPTSIPDTDTYSCYFIAPRAGTITNIKIQGYTQDTGATDPFKFYFYKGAMVSDSDTMSLTSMFNSGTITPPTANKTWTADIDVSSSNAFAENDCLYVYWKKDSNSGSQDVYWHMNISGEYS